jgi:mannose-6-phosphate isomerase-like protein (cupin superfamily)
MKKQNKKVLDMSPLGMIFTIQKTAADTRGKSLDLHWELLPGCNMKDPLIHTHPNAIETYEVLEGEMEFYVKDRWLSAKKGDKLSVPIGIAHTFRNPTNEIVRVYNTHQPALKMEEYFKEIVRILDKLTKNRTQPFKMNLETKLYMGVLMSRYRNEIIATSPPDFALRIMGFLGKLKGIHY